MKTGFAPTIGTTNINRTGLALRSRLAIGLAAALGAAVSGAMAEYQFIVTPNWNAKSASSAKSSALASSSIDLEARYRTWFESDGADIDTTELRGTTVIFR